MELNYLNTLPTGGFNFDNCIRNKAMAESSGMAQPIKTMKTGTTICGIIYEVRNYRIEIAKVLCDYFCQLTRKITIPFRTVWYWLQTPERQVAPS